MNPTSPLFGAPLDMDPVTVARRDPSLPGYLWNDYETVLSSDKNIFFQLPCQNDTTPPTTSLNHQSSSDPIIFSVNDIDNNGAATGGTSTFYLDSSENGFFNRYTEPIDLPAGSHRIYFYSRDFAGNRERLKKTDVTITDIIPPAPVTDLVSTPSTSVSIRLNWTVTGDDGFQRTAKGHYWVNISTDPVLLLSTRTISSSNKACILDLTQPQILPVPSPSPIPRPSSTPYPSFMGNLILRQGVSTQMLDSAEKPYRLFDFLMGEA